jgi:hypothetical protein
VSVHIIDSNHPSAWVIQDDEGGHTGTAAPSTLSYGKNMDGSVDSTVVVIPCPEPGCGIVSFWPYASLPPLVQQALE